MMCNACMAPPIPAIPVGLVVLRLGGCMLLLGGCGTMRQPCLQTPTRCQGPCHQDHEGSNALLPAPCCRGGWSQEIVYDSSPAHEDEAWPPCEPPSGHSVEVRAHWLSDEEDAPGINGVALLTRALTAPLLPIAAVPGSFARSHAGCTVTRHSRKSCFCLCGCCWCWRCCSVQGAPHVPEAAGNVNERGHKALSLW